MHLTSAWAAQLAVAAQRRMPHLRPAAACQAPLDEGQQVPDSVGSSAVFVVQAKLAGGEPDEDDAVAGEVAVVELEPVAHHVDGTGDLEEGVADRGQGLSRSSPVHLAIPARRS